MHGKLIEIDAIGDIIARHKTYAEFRQAELFREPRNGPLPVPLATAACAAAAARST